MKPTSCANCVTRAPVVCAPFPTVPGHPWKGLFWLCEDCAGPWPNQIERVPMSDARSSKRPSLDDYDRRGGQLVLDNSTGMMSMGWVRARKGR